jgi:hypothetical protein
MIAVQMMLVYFDRLNSGLGYLFAEPTGVSGATNSKRPAARSSALSPGPRAGFASGPGSHSFLRRPDRRSPAETIPRMWAVQQRYRDSFLRFCPGAYRVRKLALQFRAMLRWRRTGRLAQWIATVTSSGFSFLAQFARTLRRDLGAVELAIETPWNSGPIEGQINRFKVIKCQMYGRAGFELLRARVLPLSV